MGQKDLIYAAVARGTVILAEFSEFTGNFGSVAAQYLQNLPSGNSKFTYNFDGHTFSYLAQNGFVFCVVADESVGRQLPFAFLERVRDEFMFRYGNGKATTAAANSLNREFGPKLKEHIQYCVDHPDEVNKLAKVKAQVSEVKDVMLGNIDNVVERGVKIDVLVGKTNDLQTEARVYRGQGTQLKRKMWMQNMKMKLIVLGIVVSLVLIILLSICNGFKCFK